MGKDFSLLTEETTDSFAEFTDQHIQAYLSDPISEPELHQLVKMYQTHAHSETCRRYKTFLADPRGELGVGVGAALGNSWGGGGKVCLCAGYGPSDL